MTMADGEQHRIRADLGWLMAGLADAGGASSVESSGLQHDSRRVCPGDLFVAMAGLHTHGMSHAQEAITRGCAAIAYDPAGEGERLAQGITDVPAIPVAELPAKLGLIADRYFGKPSSRLNVIGITGTNGKTSCSHFLAEALSGEAPAAAVGTMGWGVPGNLAPTAHTTPDAIEIHSILHRLERQGFESIAMEASSHGLDQGRLNGVRFKNALYTNFTRDHLDYHGTMAAYLEAKLRLLDWPGLEFVAFNADDAELSAAILRRTPPGIRLIGFSVSGKADLPVPMATVSELRQGAEGVTFQARFNGQVAAVSAPVFGHFNVENLAASLTALLGLGHTVEEAAAALRRVQAVPGRMERFAGAGRTALVDYAHTPDALHSVLSSLRSHCGGRLWVVFGCGGDRDRGKRPEMGAIAEKLADKVVVTDDNPRSEDGDAIVREILAGCTRDDLATIRDRRAALEFALERAGPDDLVLIAGKGHEATQEIQGQKYPFSDRQVVTEVLARLGTAQ